MLIQTHFAAHTSSGRDATHSYENAKSPRADSARLDPVPALGGITLLKPSTQNCEGTWGCQAHVLSLRVWVGGFTALLA